MNDLSKLGGWVEDKKGVEAAMKDLPFPVFSDVRSEIKGSGRGKKMLLYEIIRKVAGTFPMRTQTIGDCVAMGAAYAIDAIKAVDIYIKKDFEQWVAETAVEDIYHGSRNIIGKGKLGNSDGSLGVWAAQYVNQYGSLARGKYGNIDLTTYSGARSREWGNRGYKLPNEFIEIVKEHPVEIVSQVNSYEEVIDLIYNGYAVTVASGQGFSSLRDSKGFSKPSGSWQHQMSILAYDDEDSRPGVLLQNSWGPNWIKGPKRHDQPDGSFWVDAEDIEKRVLRTGDCWAFSGYKGFKPQKLDTRII